MSKQGSLSEDVATSSGEYVLVAKCDAIVITPAQRILQSGLKKGQRRKGSYRATGNGWGVSMKPTEVFVGATVNSKPIQIRIDDDLREFFDGRLTEKRLNGFRAAMPESIRLIIWDTEFSRIHRDDLNDWFKAIK